MRRAAAAAAAKVLSCYLALLCLLSVCLCSGIEDTCYIRFNFTVKDLSLHCYEGQCSVNGKPFLQYKDNKAKPLGNLGMEVNATKAWEDLTETIKGLLEELNKNLHNMKSWPVKTKGNHILEGTLVLQYEQGRLSDSFWTFTIDRQHSFHFYPTNKLWDPPQHKANSIIREFENSIDLEDHLSMFSMGDFNNCHNMFLKLWKDVPRSTITAQDIAQLTSANTTSTTVNGTSSVPDSQHLKANWSLFLLLILIRFII